MPLKEQRRCKQLLRHLNDLLAFTLFINSLVNVLEILNGHWHVNVVKDVQGLLCLRVDRLSFSLDDWLIDFSHQLAR